MTSQTLKDFAWKSVEIEFPAYSRNLVNIYGNT